ncbi:MAG: SurA N-terminal domain-containing protein [Candidatus Saccharimonadia bacterium]
MTKQAKKETKKLPSGMSRSFVFDSTGWLASVETISDWFNGVVVRILKWLQKFSNLVWEMIPKKYRKPKLIGAWIVGFIALNVIITAVGIYGLGWQNWYTRSVSWIVPYPVAFVNGSMINYHDYYGYSQIIKANLERARSIDITAKSIDQQALGELINQSFYNVGSTKYQVSVTDGDVNSAVSSVFTEYGGEATAMTVIKQSSGMNLSQYSNAVRNSILRSRLDNKIQLDPVAIAATRTQATLVLLSILHGGDFSSLAKQYSKEQSFTSDGQVATTPSTNLPTIAQRALYAVNDGSVVATLTIDGNRMYILKRISSSNGVINAQVILFETPGIDQWLISQYKSAKIYRLLWQTKA